jgi:hypothetical protein
MAQPSLFSESYLVPDSVYECLRRSNHPAEIEARNLTDQLWQIFKPYADAHFEGELRTDFHSRFWEMYLTCTLLEKKFTISCPKPGPDILIKDPTQQIWIEAVAPDQGATRSPDRVPDRIYNVVTDHPERQIILRYRAAIHEKYEIKYKDYVRNGIVRDTEAFIIAVNSSKLPNAWPDWTIPEIIKAVFPVGDLQLEIGCRSRTAVGSNYQYRASIRKNSGAPVDTDTFLNPAYEGITGILFSHVYVTRYPKDLGSLGSDFVFIHNPLARNRVREGYFGFGAEYTAQDQVDTYELRRVEHNC